MHAKKKHDKSDEVTNDEEEWTAVKKNLLQY